MIKIFKLTSTFTAGIFFFLLIAISLTTPLAAQKNLELQAHVTYDQRLSDIWGYIDESGKEYALVCLQAAIAIEDITDPANPVNISTIPAPRSIWRDAKTYGQYAYFINEGSQGLQIVNLENLPAAPDSTHSYFWEPDLPGLGTLSTCHNIYIDTNTGYGFLAGCNINNGGILILDLFSTPGQPQFVAAAAPVYAHDVFAKGNLIYSSDIYAGGFAIQNFSDPNNIYTVGFSPTPFSFTHNAWLSADENYLFTTDEKRNAPLASYDISNPDDIRLLDEFRPVNSIGTGLIPHNTHVIDQFLVTSFYSEGVIITDATHPDNLIEVAHYDTFDGANGGFDGVWGAFPYFPSQTIVASDIDNGLFILKPAYVQACYLEGIVLDSISGTPLSDVTVAIESSDPNLEYSRINGEFKTGQVSPGTFVVSFKKTGYIPKKMDVNLLTGEITTLNVELVKGNPKMSASSELSSNCVPASLRLIPAIIDSNYIYTWTINNDDGSIVSNEITPLIELEQSGAYQIELSVQYPNGFVEVVNVGSAMVEELPLIDYELELNDNTLTIINNTPNAERFFWKFGDGEQSEEFAPVHTYQSAGNYFLEVTASNQCGGSTVSSNVNLTATSTIEWQKNSKFAILQNPFSEKLAIDYQLPESVSSKKLHWQVFNILGQKVDSGIFPPQSSGILSIGGNWETGLFWVRILSDRTPLKTMKVIKER